LLPLLPLHCCPCTGDVILNSMYRPVTEVQIDFYAQSAFDVQCPLPVCVGSCVLVRVCWFVCVGPCVLVRVCWFVCVGSCVLVRVCWFVCVGSCVGSCVLVRVCWFVCVGSCV
jgi:hypothetical protein